MVGRDDHRATASGCAHGRSAASGSRCGRTAGRTSAHDPVDEQVGALLPAPSRAAPRDPSTQRLPVGATPVTVSRVELGFDRTRTLRGAVCGAVAADCLGAPAAARQGRLRLALRRRRAARQGASRAATAGMPSDFAMHVPNGAAVRRRLRQPRSDAAGSAGAAGTVAPRSSSTSLIWPLGAVSDRVHPARDELPTLVGQPPRVRAGAMAPPAVRAGARRARAAPQRRARARRRRPRRRTTRATATAASSTPSASAPRARRA